MFIFLFFGYIPALFEVFLYLPSQSIVSSSQTHSFLTIRMSNIAYNAATDKCKELCALEPKKVNDIKLPHVPLGSKMSKVHLKKNKKTSECMRHDGFTYHVYELELVKTSVVLLKESFLGLPKLKSDSAIAF